MSINNHEPPPKKNDNPAVWDLVLKDIEERDSEGLKKYGTHLQPFNGRNSTIDLYQELLDAVVYCRQLIEERREMVYYLKEYANKIPNDKLEEFLNSIGEVE